MSPRVVEARAPLGVGLVLGLVDELVLPWAPLVGERVAIRQQGQVPDFQAALRRLARAAYPKKLFGRVKTTLFFLDADLGLATVAEVEPLRPHGTGWRVTLRDPAPNWLPAPAIAPPDLMQTPEVQAWT